MLTLHESIAKVKHLGNMATENEKSNILPLPVSLLLCDQVISDATSGKKTLVGIFHQVKVVRFPTEYKPVSLYAQLYDGEGEYDIRIDYVNVEDQAKLAEVVGTFSVRERHKPIELAIALPPIPILKPGEYEFRLWIDNQYIQRIRFTAVPKERR